MVFLLWLYRRSALPDGSALSGRRQQRRQPDLHDHMCQQMEEGFGSALFTAS